MYRDTEQTYGDWTLDVYQDREGQWVCDYWLRSKPELGGTVCGRRRREVIEEAKAATREGR